MGRGVVEGDLRGQGANEAISYTLDVSGVGSSPSGVTVVVQNVDNGYADVTSAVMPTNSPTVSGDVITLSHLRNLTAGVRYRVNVRYTVDGNGAETIFYVRGER